MKNLSCRTRILASVVLINLIGGVLLVFFLHGSYADGLNNSVTEAGVQGLDAWEQLIPPDGFHPVAEPTRALD
ncbi:MAG: hypothetical protein JXP37_08360, partial [Coriobacteriia bacterium]|nr:hypothetical protein [Coriobacteriia bacterium]